MVDQLGWVRQTQNSKKEVNLQRKKDFSNSGSKATVKIHYATLEKGEVINLLDISHRLLKNCAIIAWEFKRKKG